jgi:hypothetical protein
VDVEGVGPEGGARQTQDERGNRQQRSSIEAVAERAAPQRTADEQWELDETDDADPQTRVRSLVDLIRDGDDREVTAK